MKRETQKQREVRAKNGPVDKAWEPQRQMMTQFVPHEHEGLWDQCERCGFHRLNLLAHPTCPPTEPK